MGLFMCFCVISNQARYIEVPGESGCSSDKAQAAPSSVLLCLIPAGFIQNVFACGHVG